MKIINLLIFSLFVSVFLVSFTLATPSGADTAVATSSSANAASAGNDPNALAGNITGLTLTGLTTTQTWQGYFGNVTGTIQLADSSDNVMYNWSLASPEGEVYASTASSITWSSIACASQAQQTTLESNFNIASDDVDGVQETFGLDNHAEFYTNNHQFSAGACNNTKVFNNAGVGTFDEVLLSDGSNTVFAALLQDDIVGFDAATHDFEMLVLEDGHGTDTAVTQYNFWVELE